MNEVKKNIKDFFVNKRASASFVSILGYKNSKNEVSNQQIICNVDYERVLRESIIAAKLINKVTLDGQKYDTSNETFVEAKSEVVTSLEKSLQGNNERGIAQAKSYVPVSRNVRIHKESGNIHISGVTFKKEVIVKGEYKKVNSSLKTLLKNEIKKHLSVSKWRNFALKEDNFSGIAIEGEKLSYKDIYC